MASPEALRADFSKLRSGVSFDAKTFSSTAKSFARVCKAQTRTSVHVRELPCNVATSARRKRAAQAFVADTVDEKEVDSVVRMPGFKHRVNHSVFE